MGLRIAFMGSPAFSIPCLEVLYNDGYEIVAVYTQPPRPAGRRGLERICSPVHERALKLGLPIYTPKNFRAKEDQDFFQDLNLDIAVVVAYGLLLPKPILDAPKFGCYNIHASLLPRWRGAAPIQRAIMAGDSVSGVMLMKMDEGLDTGPILASTQVPILEETNSGELHEIFAQKGAELIHCNIEKIAQGKANLIAQRQEGATYAEKISKEEARICWNEAAFAIQRKILALSPFPGAYCEMLIKDKWERVKLLNARLLQKTNEEKNSVKNEKRNEAISLKSPTLFEEGETLQIACLDGHFIEILTLQRAGGKVLSGKEFLNGTQPQAIR